MPWWLTLIICVIGGAVFSAACFLFVTAKDYPEDDDNDE